MSDSAGEWCQCGLVSSYRLLACFPLQPEPVCGARHAARVFFPFSGRQARERELSTLDGNISARVGLQSEIIFQHASSVARPPVATEREERGLARD